MLFKELQNLTDDHCTHEEYEAINKIYMRCNDMTQQDAADIWWWTYGRAFREVSESKLLTALYMAAAAFKLYTNHNPSANELAYKILTCIHQLSEIYPPLQPETGIETCVCGKPCSR